MWVGVFFWTQCISERKCCQWRPTNHLFSNTLLNLDHSAYTANITIRYPRWPTMRYKSLTCTKSWVWSALSSTRRQKLKKVKQTNACAPLIQNRLRFMKAVRKEIEWLWRKGFAKEMSLSLYSERSREWWHSIYTVSEKRDYISTITFINKCQITIIFGIVSSKSMCHRKMVSFPKSPI